MSAFGKSLRSATTISLGGVPGAWVKARSVVDLTSALHAAAAACLQPYILGGGSNCVVADIVDHVCVIQLEEAPPEVRLGPEGTVFVTAAGGQSWDSFVQWTVGQRLQGIECLAGIPGTVGAAPVQNIGAYGQEVADTLVSLEAFDLQTQDVARISSAECGFGYRESRFNTVDIGVYVILSVTFLLTVDGYPCLKYPELIREADDAGATELVHIADLVRAIRARKGMLIDETDQNSQSVGSFFRNPIVSIETFNGVLSAGIGDSVPAWDVGPDSIKLSAAWLMEACGFHRGQVLNKGVYLSHKHVLALVTQDDATAADVVAAAVMIQDRVVETVGITLIPEPCWIGFPITASLPHGALRACCREGDK